MNKISILAATLFLVTTLPAQARPRRPGARVPPAVMEKLMKDAGLSDGQVRTIRAFHEDIQKNQLDIKHQLETLHLELRRALDQYQVDESAVMAKIDRIGELRLQMRKNQLRARLAARKEMTEAQWKTLRSLMAEKRMNRRQQFRQQIHQRFRPAPPPPAK